MTPKIPKCHDGATHRWCMSIRDAALGVGSARRRCQRCKRWFEDIRPQGIPVEGTA